MGTESTQPRIGMQLIAATREFAKEDRRRSWWYLWTTLLVTGCALVGAAIAPYWWVKLPLALLGSLVMVRGFILFHDYMHGAILRKSKLAKIMFYAFGLFFMTPPYHWRKTHNYHHANVGKLAESHIGSFPVMTIEQWREAGFWQRFYYRLARHPITIMCASLGVFAFANCLGPALQNPKKEWTGLVSIALQGGVITGLWFLGGFWLAFWAWILPYAVATALGAYLFFAQHNFPEMKFLAPDEWNLPEAAMVSCSWMNLGPFMRWFTGEIGYHHVHHLNAGIPFYRLEEAMKALPEAQHPGETGLTPRQILGCFNQKLWDPVTNQMVTFKHARAA